MDNISISGVNKEYIPLSEAFSIETISKEAIIDKNILSITNISLQTSSEYIETFSSLDEQFVTVGIDIAIRFDYICEENSYNYKIINENKLLNICIGNNKLNKNISIHEQILDMGIIDIEDDKVRYYLVVVCSLCI